MSADLAKRRAKIDDERDRQDNIRQKGVQIQQELAGLADKHAGYKNAEAAHIQGDRDTGKIGHPPPDGVGRPSQEHVGNGTASGSRRVTLKESHPPSKGYAPERGPNGDRDLSGAQMRKLEMPPEAQL